MIVKKPAVLLYPSANLHSLCTYNPLAPTSPHPPPKTTRSKPFPRRPRTQTRCYTQVADRPSPRHEDDLSWPILADSKRIPSPYQIFNIKKGVPYSKKRYYELVKLYHPDRNVLEGRHCPNSGVPHAVKLERYRLIVAANSILSDPSKRHAYDAWGAGWNGQPEVGKPSYDTDGSFSHGANWRRGGIDDCSGNATWEDWERWYRRHDKEPQRPATISNGAFVAFIVLFAAFGGTLQATRAGKASMSFIEQRDMVHDEASRQLRRVRQDTRDAFGSKDERIQHFMKIRDPKGYGITDPQEEAYRRALPDPEVCSSDNIAGRNMAVYRTTEAEPVQ